MSYVIKDDGTLLFEMRSTYNVQPDFVRDLFTTALEGGIGYWSACTKYRWDNLPATEFVADIFETEDEDEPTHTIDYEVMLRGLDLFATNYPDRFINAVRDENYDAEDADMVVQLGLFGEVVYG